MSKLVMRSFMKTVAVGIFLSSVSSALATTCYVDDDANAQGADGTSWATAFKYLQDALAAAQLPDSTITVIQVAAGRYRPDQGTSVTLNDPHATFQLINGVSVLGGYYGCPGGSCGGYDPDTRYPEYFVTVLSGDLYGDDTYASCSAGAECVSLCMDGKVITPSNNGENSKHVVSGNGTDSSAVLDGVTITAGNADNTGSLPGATWGGGMLNFSGSPTLNNCTFLRNTADMGGGMANDEWSNPTLTNCKFRGNRAPSSGGGQGGGMFNNGSSSSSIPGASPTVTDCLFEFNYANVAGGAMYNDPWAKPFINRCHFENNKVEQWFGSAIYNCDGDPVVVRSWFIGNRGVPAYSQYDGNIELDHCVFSGNREGALQLGGGAAGEMSYVYNTLFTGNRKSGAGTIVYTEEPIVFINCIGFDNAPGEASLVNTVNNGSVAFQYSSVEGGTGQSWFDDNTCLDGDPLFVTDGYWDDNIVIGDPTDDCWVEGDYRLTGTSPCIDIGDNDSVQPDVGDADNDSNTAEQTPRDLAGGARFAEGDGSEPTYCKRTASDMGPFEFQGSCSIHADCADCNGCTTGTCLLGTCIYFDVAAATSCDDGLFFCTVTDACDGDGTCVGTGNPCRKNEFCSEPLQQCLPGS